MTSKHFSKKTNNRNLRKYIFLSLMFVALAGCEKEEAGVDNIQMARFYIESGNNAMSIKFIQQELQSGDRKQQAHQLAAELFDGLGYYSRAVSHLQEAIKLGCGQQCVSALVSAYLGLQAVDQAEQEFDKLTDKDTAIARYQSILINHYRNENFSETLKELKSIDLTVARESILLIKLEQGLFADLLASYDAKTEYTNAEMLIFAKAFYATKQIEKADKVLLALRLKQKGDMITNEKIETVELLVKVNLAKNQFAAADQIYQAFLEKHKGSTYSRYQNGLNHLKKSRFKSAISEIAELSRANPENMKIAYIHAAAQYGNGDYQAVVTVLEKLKAPLNDNLLALLSSSYNELYRSADTIRLLENIPRSNKLTAILSRAYSIQGNKKQALKLYDSLNNEVVSTDEVGSIGAEIYLVKLMYELELFDQIISKFSSSTEHSEEVKYLVVNSYLRLKQNDKARAYVEKQTENDLSLEMMGSLETASGQLDKAIENYKALVESSPEKKSYHLLARAYLQNNDYDMSLSAIQAGMKLSGKNQDLLILANSLLKQKDNLKARQWLESIKETNRDYEQAQMLLANYEVDIGEDAKAVKRLSSLTGAKDKRTYLLLAKAHRKLNPTKSLEMLKKSLEAEYTLAIASLLYRYYNGTGDLENLQQTINLIANKSGVNIKTANLLFRGYLRLDQSDMARELANTLVAQGHKRLGEELIGDLMVLEGDFVAAADYFKELIESEADDRLWVKFYRARLKQNLVNSDEVFKEAEGRLKQHPEMNALRNFIATSYIESNSDRAIQHLEILLAKFPDDSALLNNLAWVYLDTNPEKALEYSTMAYQKRNNNSSIIDTHVRALKRNNQDEKAEAILNEKLEISPDNEILKQLTEDLQL